MLLLHIINKFEALTRRLTSARSFESLAEGLKGSLARMDCRPGLSMPPFSTATATSFTCIYRLAAGSTCSALELQNQQQRHRRCEVSSSSTEDAKAAAAAAQELRRQQQRTKASNSLCCLSRIDCATAAVSAMVSQPLRVHLLLVIESSLQVVPSVLVCIPEAPKCNNKV